jgi:SAM-dependent methyltransferase
MLRQLAYYTRRIGEIVPERFLGIHTAEYHEQLDEKRPDFRGHMPTSYRDWRRIRPLLNAGKSCCFVDYGAGLGRVAVLAAQLSYAEIIGVELDAELARQANVNIARARFLRAPAHVICADATTFELPRNSASLFFCNPFAGGVLRSVLDRTVHSYRNNPRRLQLICNLPSESAFETGIESDTRFRRTNQIALTDHRKCLVFEPQP